jgi:hypothetical protein
MDELKMLSSVRNGNKIIGTREYNLVFYITCFVPFVRPNIPMIKDTEINRMKSLEKEKAKKRKLTTGGNQSETAPDDRLVFDMSIFDTYKSFKDNLS